MNHLVNVFMALCIWFKSGNQPSVHLHHPKKQSSRNEDRFIQAIELAERIRATDPKLARELRRR